MSAPTDNFIGHSIAETWGPPLISTFLAAIVYGITVLQTFYYYNHYGNTDRSAWLVLVAVIFILDSAALALFMYCTYYYTVLSWGITEMLAPDVKEFPIEYVLTSILVFIVQLFYINTIRALKAPLIITFLLIGVSLTSLATGLVLPAVQLRLHDILTIVVSPLNHIAFNIARGTALACDLSIVAVLCWQLGIRKTNVKRANNMINALILFSVQRGLLQAVVQLGEVLSYAIKPTGIYFLPFHVIVSRIYCTSLLATLNSREFVARKGKIELERIQRRGKGPAAEDAEAGKPSELRFAHIGGTSSSQTPEDSSSMSQPHHRNHTDYVNESEKSSGAGNATRTTKTSAASGTRPVLSSFLDPPFLFTNDERSRSDGGGRFGSLGDEFSGLSRSRRSDETPDGRSIPFPPGLESEKSYVNEENSYPPRQMSRWPKHSGHRDVDASSGSEADVSQGATDTKMTESMG